MTYLILGGAHGRRRRYGWIGVLLFAGCGGLGPENGSFQGFPGEPALSFSGRYGTWVGPSDSAQIRTLNSNVFAVPAGALKDSVWVEVQETAYEGGYEYEFLPEGTHFSPASYLRISAARLYARLGESDIDSAPPLEFSYLDPASGFWVRLDEHEIGADGTVTFRLEHFSRYAVSMSGTAE